MKTMQIMKYDFNGMHYSIVFDHNATENPFKIYKKWTEYRDGRWFADHKNIIGKGTNITWCFAEIMSDLMCKPMVMIPADYLKELVDIKQKFVG